MAEGGAVPAASPRGRGWRAWLRRVGLVAITVLVVEYLAVPQLVHATSDLTLLADAEPLLLVLAFLLEAASFASYTALTRAVLLGPVRLGFLEQLRIDLTGLGVSHVVPGGGASAAALRFRLMTQRGVPGAEAASSAAVQTASAVVGLVATFVGGVALVGTGLVGHPGYALAGVLSAAALVTVALGLRSVGRGATAGTEPAPRPAGGAPGTSTRSRLAGWFASALDRTVQLARRTARESAVLLRDPRRRLAVFGWAAGNWLFDAASLWVCLLAYGVTLHPGALLAAYGAANLLAMLPVTPGGLGIVEGFLVPALSALGRVSPAPVTLGVLTWRLLEFWLPIPLSGLTYLSLKVRVRQPFRTAGANHVSEREQEPP